MKNNILLIYKVIKYKNKHFLNIKNVNIRVHKGLL